MGENRERIQAINSAGLRVDLKLLPRPQLMQALCSALANLARMDEVWRQIMCRTASLRVVKDEPGKPLNPFEKQYRYDPSQFYVGVGLKDVKQMSVDQLTDDQLYRFACEAITACDDVEDLHFNLLTGGMKLDWSRHVPAVTLNSKLLAALERSQQLEKTTVADHFIRSCLVNEDAETVEQVFAKLGLFEDIPNLFKSSRLVETGWGHIVTLDLQNVAVEFLLELTSKPLSQLIAR